LPSMLVSLRTPMLFIVLFFELACAHRHLHSFPTRRSSDLLPVIGIRLIMPTAATGFDYEGLSGETYPDRMAGAKEGRFHIDGLPVTKYLVPQENGMHMQTKKLVINREATQNNSDQTNEKFSLSILQDKKPFNFSCLPYTAEELENATHIEELPLVRRTVLVIAG